MLDDPQIMGFTTTQDLTIKNFSLNLSPLPSFLMHGGDIATIIQKNDWSQTNLGPIKSWPNSLKTVLGMILENKLGMYIAWGLEFTQLYNESFKSVLGEVKYSVGIGNTANKTFSESWDILGPLFNQVMKGESIAQIDYLVKLERDGHIEDCYFTFSYSPIRVDSGQVGGVLVTTIETTARVKSDLAIKASMADALRAEAILQEVLSQAPLGIAILQGPNHVFTLTNPYYLKTLFKNERKLLGKAARDAVPEIAGQGFLELLDTVYRTGKSYVGNETSMKIIQHDGTEREFFRNFNYQALIDENNKSTGILVVFYDVTEQVLSRERLKRSEERFRQLAESLTDQVVHITELDPHIISYVSPSYEFVWQKSIASLYENPLSFMDMVHPEDRHILVQSRQQQDSGIEVTCEYRLLFEDGTIRYIEDNIYPLKDKNGKAYRATGIAEDITERKLNEKRLKDSEEKFRIMTDTMPQIVWSTLPDGFHDFYNKRWYEYTGAPGDSIDRDVWCSMFHPEDLQSSWKLWKHSLETGDPYQAEYRLKHHSGEYRWTLGRALPIRDEAGQITRWMGTCTDIHDLKNLRQSLEETQYNLLRAKDAAESANRSKSAFLANMSHEIRTPLGAILGFSELMKNNELESERREQYLETVRRNGKALTRIIDDILDLAKVEAGKLEIEEIDFSLWLLMREVIDVFKESTKNKGVFLSLNIPDSVPKWIMSDPTRLRQILFNIVGNAVKFTNEGEVSVNVIARFVNDRTIALEIRVKDTGCGLTMEQKSRLFQPFCQADSSTTRQFGGTGLGLVLSKRLCEALGGSVSIEETNPDVGCTFLIEILATQSQDAPESEVLIVKVPKQQLQDSLNSLNSLKVLVVDDSEDNRFLMLHILQKYGAEVEVAVNGSDALEKAAAQFFDIILMDIQMPFMDGYQAMAELQKREYKSPVIALTAHAMVEERLKTRKSGFSGHLTKPLNIQELIKTIINSVGPFKRDFNWDEN